MQHLIFLGGGEICHLYKLKIFFFKHFNYNKIGTGKDLHWYTRERQKRSQVEKDEIERLRREEELIMQEAL